jgi:hypothetical protein
MKKMFFLLLVVFSQFEPAYAGERNSEKTIWVEKIENEGRQCEPSHRNFDVNQLELKAQETITQKQLHILQRTSTDLPVCKACGCPIYSRQVRIQIPAEDLELAREGGYKQ